MAEPYDKFTRQAKNRAAWFLMNRAFQPKGLGYKVVNEDKLLMGRRILAPDPGCTGFPNYPELPIIEFTAKLKPAARDLEWCGAYWLISDKLKNIFEEVDPEAFAFMECRTVYANSEPAPKYWMCDVTKTLDAVDEDRSNVDIRIQGETRVYQLWGDTRFVLKDDVIRGARVFRLKYRYASVCCDAALRRSCIDAKVQGVSFRAISW
jgi:hypothetical protein